MKRSLILVVILAGILGINMALLRSQYGRRDARDAGDAAAGTAAPESETPQEVPAVASPEEPAVAAAKPETGSEGAEDEDKGEEKDKAKDEEEEWLFPKLKDRPAYPVPADFGKEIPIWRESIAAAREFSGIDPARFAEVVATVNGETISYGELLDEVVLRFGEKFVEDYRNDLVLLREITGEGLQVSDEDMKVGETDYWELLHKKGVRNVEDLHRKFKWTEAFLRRKVYVNEGGKRVFAKDMGVEDPSKSEPLFLQVWMGKILGRYDQRSVYGEGGEELPDGVLAKVGDFAIRPRDIAPFLVPSLKEFHFSMALDGLIEWKVFLDAIREGGIAVKDEEVNAAIEAERKKYVGSFFSYETMLQIGDTNVPMERRKYAMWIAHDKLFGKPTEEELRRHFAAHPVYFGRGALAACEIRTLALDPDTGKLRGEGAWEGARDRILEARNELEAGKPFQRLVMRYSENPETKKFDNASLFNKKTQRVAGSIGIFPIREGRMSNEIAAAAFAAPKGEWIGPVRTRDGYVLIYVLDAKPPRDIRYDPEPYTDVNGNGRYDQGEPIVDENHSGFWNAGQEDVTRDDLEGERVRRWLDDLLAKAQVTREPVLFR